MENRNVKTADRSIAIVGAGIGGLTTAIALEKKEMAPKIFERAQTLMPVGAGILLGSNAMQVYKKLGLYHQIESVGYVVDEMRVTDHRLHTLSKLNLRPLREQFGVCSIAIHRGALQGVLVDALEKTDLRLNHDLNRVDATSGKVHLGFRNGEKHMGDLLIGADGIRSNVRLHCFGDMPARRANQICWRGVLNYKLPSAFQHQLNEAWGMGTRFGFTQINSSKVYWFALRSCTDSWLDKGKEAIIAHFANYHSVVKDLIASTPVSSIHLGEIEDLRPHKNWHADRVCLLGDAAHATTPNMGQGACQAIVDAHVLAACLDQFQAPEAFEVYQKVRMARAHQIVRTSYRIGQLAHLRHPLARGLRNLMMRLVPEGVNQRQNEQIHRLDNLGKLKHNFG